MNTFYLCTFTAAIILSVIYTFKWQRRFDINITLCFFLVPFVNLAYYLMYSVNKEDTVIFALKITYLGGVFLTWFIKRGCHSGKLTGSSGKIWEPSLILTYISIMKLHVRSLRNTTAKRQIKMKDPGKRNIRS